MVGRETLNEVLAILRQWQNEPLPSSEAENLAETVRAILEYLERQNEVSVPGPVSEEAGDADEQAGEDVFHRIRTGPGLVSTTTPDGEVISLAHKEADVEPLPRAEPFPAKIETEVGSGAYTFTEQWLTDATTWADKTGGRTGTVYEINDVTGIAVGKIILVAVRHDTSGNLRYIFDHSGSAASTRIVKIVSYAAGVYVVQPVVRADDAWANDGSQLTGIHNHGEVQTDEAGYLAGPAGQDIYVPLFTAGDESFILVHPPRMV